jgi:hypothetical protein
MRSVPVIADLPLESRVDCISVFLLASLEVAPGAACSNLGRRQSAFGFHPENRKVLARSEKVRFVPVSLQFATYPDRFDPSA